MADGHTTEGELPADAYVVVSAQQPIYGSVTVHATWHRPGCGKLERARNRLPAATAAEVLAMRLLPCAYCGGWVHSRQPHQG